MLADHATVVADEATVVADHAAVVADHAAIRAVHAVIARPLDVDTTGTVTTATVTVAIREGNAAHHGQRDEGHGDDSTHAQP